MLLEYVEHETHILWTKIHPPIVAPRCANPPAVPTLNTRSGVPIEDKAAYVETVAAVVATLFPPKRLSLKR